MDTRHCINPFVQTHRRHTLKSEPTASQTAGASNITTVRRWASPALLTAAVVAARAPTSLVQRSSPPRVGGCLLPWGCVGLQGVTGVKVRLTSAFLQAAGDAARPPRLCPLLDRFLLTLLRVHGLALLSDPVPSPASTSSYPSIPSPTPCTPVPLTANRYFKQQQPL